MIILIFTLVVICILLISYIIFLNKEYRNINEQIAYINNNETNAEVVSTTKTKEIKYLIDNINVLIKANKQKHIQQVQHENQLREAISSISHDLKTPLTVAQGYTQLIKVNDSNQQELLMKISNSLTSVNQYINYLNNYVVIVERIHKLKYSKVNVSEQLKNELFIYYDQLNNRRLNIQPNIEDNIQMYSDEFLITRIIQNIIGNISKYAKSYCIIDLKVDNKNNLILSAINDYKGNLNNVNDLALRFNTTDKSRTNQSIGLGLSIIKECSETLGGKMNLDNSNNEYKIEISIPIKKASF